VSSDWDRPIRQFLAAWESATAIAADWAERTTAVTVESFHKLASDPAIRAVVKNWRLTPFWVWRECECPCATAHPDDPGVCDRRAVITRRLSFDAGSAADVPLCAPCAVAQGVAEMPR
jgi:hypothetical protein